MHGALAAADIARLTHLTAQTVSLISKRLLDDGLLLKGAPQRGKVGQPSVPLRSGCCRMATTSLGDGGGPGAEDHAGATVPAHSASANSREARTRARGGRGPAAITGRYRSRTSPPLRFRVAPVT